MRTHAALGAPPPAAMAARTRRLLDGPIAPTLLRLAAPNVVVLVVQVGLNTLEAYFVGWLGAEAIAGVSVAFPVIMLMQTMSAGGMGGGVASAVARALGSGRQADADALVLHALLIALGMGGLFTLGVLVGGRTLYAAMGAAGSTLAAALAYSNVIFAGAVLVWLFNTLASVVRGAGNMQLPAVVVIAGAPLTAVLSPALIFGWGRLPRLGVAGAATAFLTYYALGAVVFLVYLRSAQSLATLKFRGVRLRARLFSDILRVGAPGIVNTVQTNLTIVILTGLVGASGTAALAGYGMGVRLEYMMIPLVFGIGAALVTMVGTNYGAGQRVRARRVAWVGAATAAAITETIGLLAAVFPRVWIGLFSSDPEVLAVGAAYLRTVGPAYGFFGLGLALYFASQGAGRVLWPILAGLARLSVAGLGGWIVVHALGGGLVPLFLTMAIALAIFGATITVAIARGAWQTGGNP